MGLNVAVLTVSDTRTPETDKSGQFLADALAAAGHTLAAREIIPDDLYRIRARVAAWIADSEVEAILTTGGTGFTGRDTTPDALGPLFDQHIPGFGELFRQLSAQEIGSSTIQSRALGGWSNRTVIFCLPGSTGACRTAWNGILKEQLDADHRPCNFAELIRSGAQPH